MRVQQALVANNQDQARELQDFADQLLEIGDGKTETLAVPSLAGSTNSDLIRIPNYMIVPGNNLINLLKEVYPSLYTSEPSIDPRILISSTILTTKNKDVATINKLMLDVFPGNAKIYYSADKITDAEQEISFPPEFLNTIDTGSLPPHALVLKVGVSIMLLRNINPKNGLCNGTRLIVKSLLPNIIEAYMAIGSHIGTVTYIPRIKIQTNDDPSVVVPFERCQFPVRLAFGMTINKAQGQTINRIGIYLPNHVFGHGQLYVALSRVKAPKSIKIMIDKSCNSTIPENVSNGIHVTLYSQRYFSRN
jgi:ATP-dependent DNA helicase PIF1